MHLLILHGRGLTYWHAFVGTLRFGGRIVTGTPKQTIVSTSYYTCSQGPLTPPQDTPCICQTTLEARHSFVAGAGTESVGLLSSRWKHEKTLRNIQNTTGPCKKSRGMPTVPLHPHFGDPVRKEYGSGLCLDNCQLYSLISQEQPNYANVAT